VLTSLALAAATIAFTPRADMGGEALDRLFFAIAAIVEPEQWPTKQTVTTNLYTAMA
jgi:hypothetical protein